MRAREILGHWQYFPGFHYLFIDYQGYGLNEGRTHYQNMYKTALAAYEYATNHPYVHSNKIVVMGFSLGTASAVYLAANRPVEGLILLTPYSRGVDLYNNLLPIFHGPMTLLVRQNLPSYQYAPLVNSPVLIIASQDDEIIPFSSSKELSTFFQREVEFMELRGARHNDVFRWPGVMDKIQWFLEELD
jgi:pimeloyl-ACP methyl ester carboxylesterase